MNREEVICLLDAKVIDVRKFGLIGLVVGGMLLISVGTSLAGTNKVEICHVPPGNPDNAHTIVVSEKALDAHLGHGDHEGPCGETPVTDTDGDGLSDGDEVNVYGTDPLNGDTDSDGLSDGDEVNVYGTDPLLGDTDGGSIPDGIEVLNGTDPLDPSDDDLGSGF